MQIAIFPLSFSHQEDSLLRNYPELSKGSWHFQFWVLLKEMRAHLSTGLSDCHHLSPCVGTYLMPGSLWRTLFLIYSCGWEKRSSNRLCDSPKDIFSRNSQDLDPEVWLPSGIISYYSASLLKPRSSSATFSTGITQESIFLLCSTNTHHLWTFNHQAQDRSNSSLFCLEIEILVLIPSYPSRQVLAAVVACSEQWTYHGLSYAS